MLIVSEKGIVKISTKVFMVNLANLMNYKIQCLLAEGNADLHCERI